ncbi:MAG: hypothetical protein SF339_18905 [Blastocatellia bacterium]|nr:hypothetical protein [Blastocatellia bacterium]
MSDTIQPKTRPRRVRAEDVVAEIGEQLGEHTIAAIYRDRVRTIRTRSYTLDAPARRVPVEIQYTLLGIELKIGKRRLLCPDLATARYLRVFAWLGAAAVAVPYDITRISRLADDLESSWHRMLMLAEHLTGGGGPRLRGRVESKLIAREREAVEALGAGPAVPQFNQNTKQRKAKRQ